jgi:glycosyltransferase involved in cell wall biosynthesis
MDMNTSPTQKEFAAKRIRADDVESSHNGIFAVIPACNEEQGIGSVILLTRQHVDRVIVVDDGSSDRTSLVAKSAGAEVIRLDQTTGRAYALLLGLQRAREGKCSVAVTIAGGGQHNPMEIERVAGNVLSGKADLVIGSHYLTRRLPLYPYEKFDQMILDSGTLITDSNSSFMAFSRAALDHLDFRTDGFRLNRDLIPYFDKQSLKILEVPITLLKPRPDHSRWGYPVKVLAAMPALNEEKFIAKTILGAQKYVDRVLVVDDGSTDATGEIAQRLGAIVVRHEKNAGYGAALRTIFEKAKELHVDALVILDSDGQHDPNDIRILVNRLENGDVDVVIGSRFAKGKPQTIPKYRIFGMKVLDSATTIAGVHANTDTQSGFRVYGKKAIEAVHITGNGMSAGSEILIQLTEKNLKIAQLPINVCYDTGESSSQNPVSHGIMVIYKLIGLISYRRPLPAFGIPGFILILIGIIAGSAAFSEYYTTSKFPFIFSMISAMSLIMGLLLIIGALILNYLVMFVRDHKLSSQSAKRNWEEI